MLFLIAAIIIIVVCIHILKTSGNKKEVLRKYNMYLSKSKEYIDLGNTEKALELCDRAMELCPNEFYSYTLKGEMYYDMNKYEQALLELDKSIYYNDSDVDTYLKRIMCNYSLSKFNKIIEDCNKILELNSLVFEVYYFRGISFKEICEYEKSIADLSSYISKNHRNDKAYFTRASCFFNCHKYDLALDDISKSIEINSKLSYYIFKSSIYTKLNLYEEALSFLYNSIKIFPNEFVLYKLIVNNHLAMKDFDKAKAIADKAISIEDNPNTNSLLWYVYARDSNYEEALKVVDKILKMDDSHYTTLNNRAFTLIRLGRYEEALKDIIYSIEINNQLANSYKNYAHILYKLGDINQAKETISKAINMDVNNGESYIISAAINLYQNNIDTCLSDLVLGSAKNITYFDYLQDSIFDSIRESEQFKLVLNKAIS